MKDPLNVIVSEFQNTQTPADPRNVNLGEWLLDDRHKETVIRLRKSDSPEERSRIKKMELPAITPSGTFSYRANSQLIQHSGLCCIDIDGDHNPHISDWEEAKRDLSDVVNIAYCGLSVGGNGLFAIIPIAYTEKHGEHFDTLKYAFTVLGYKVDESCRDITRLRIATFDPTPHIYTDAETYCQVLERPATRSRTFSPSLDRTEDDVKKLIGKISQQGVDITSSYEVWRNIGFALASEFGERGRDMYHEVSRHHPDYREQECNRQYDRCMSGRGGGIGIATFFYYCKQHGITLKTR